jgi:hypothetical protein
MTAGAPPKYHSCFISYSSKDATFAHKLYGNLKAKGVECWFAPENLKIGDETRTSLDKAIYGRGKLLLILSKNSLSSDWVQKEVETAFEKEQAPPRTLALFPIRIDDSVMTTTKAWAADVRRMRNIGDFRKWKNPSAYAAALRRLLRDLAI